MLSFPTGITVPVGNILQGDHQPAGATAAVVTFPAKEGHRTIVQNIQWSYDTAPTGGLLTVVSGATTIFSLNVSAAGPGGYNLTLIGGINEAVVVTLASGAGAVVGKLNAQGCSISQ